jgi:nitroreductase
MSFLWKKVRPYLRVVYRIYKGFSGFAYDFYRMLSFGGWKEDMHDAEQRNYYSVMVYHALEKSLSYKKRNKTSGWKNALKLLELLQVANNDQTIGYHDKASKKVLEEFIGLPENRNDDRALKINEELENIAFTSSFGHGVKQYSSSDYHKGVLSDPESFFCSRYSLREFKDQVVDEALIMRAIKLSMKTPSVCNRQAWHIYHTSDDEVKKAVLNYQNGNKPFGERIPNLFIVTTDLKGFFSSEEHYQHWIDGGLLSMSLMYALHSLGIASCPLNWSQSPKTDKALRKIVNIKPNHTVIMFMAVGYPDENNKVCISARRPVDEIFTTLTSRK